MVPIVSITHIISVAVSLFLALRLRASYQKNPSTSLEVFALFFFLFAVSWAFAAVPGVISRDVMAIMASNIVSGMMLYAAIAVAVYIPLFFLGKPHLAIVASSLVAFISMVYLVGRLFASEPSVLVTVSPFVYWKPIYPAWIRIMSGVVSFVSSILFASTFYYLGYKSTEDAVVRRRSFYLAVGMTLMTISALIVQLIPSTSFISFSVGAILLCAGLLVMADGIMYEYRAIFLPKKG